MLKRMIVGAGALALLAGVALAAQDNINTVQTLPSADTQIADNASGNPPPPPPPDADQGPGQGGGWWQGWMGHGHRGHHRGWGEGQEGMMGGPGGPGGPMMGAMMRGPGFHMHLGPGIDVGVMCGQEAMKDCIASAQPLIDAAKAAVAAQPAASAPKAP